MKRRVILLLLLLAGGAIINIAVAWLVFPGKPSDWSAVKNRANVDQSHLIADGVPTFDSVSEASYESFGFRDRTYSTFLDPAVNKYRLQYARETACGWPCLALRGIRWSPIRFNEQARRHEFTQEQVRVTAIHLSDARVMHGEREFLPAGPIWPAFAINTLFYAGVLWLLFAAPFALRRRSRRRRGLCPKCAYPVGSSDTCTECGKPVQPRTPEAA